MAPDVTIDPEFRDLIPPLGDEELAQLERSIVADGCRDPLVVWPQGDGAAILLDGHHRHTICEANGIDYWLIEQELSDRNDAMAWIIQNQFARRNLSAYTRAELALKLKPLLAKKAKGNQGTRTDLSQKSAESLNPIDTRDELAAAAGLSHDTIHKAAVISERADADTKKALRAGDTSINAEYTKLKRAEKEDRRETRREENREKVADTPDPIDAGARFATIVIDPPWDWGDEGDVDQMGRARPTYGTMSYDELLELAVDDLADDDCHLYLWITNRSLPKGFALMEAWGFRYVTCLTWCKPSFGMGNYFRGQTEQVLFGVKGSQPLKRKDVGTWFAADRGPRGHSSKPEVFTELVESCSPGPYLEMFARSTRDDWTSWGAEA